MAIQTNATGSGVLLLPAGFNYKQAMTGSTPGLTLGFMVRIPATGFNSNTTYRFGGYDANGDGAYSGGNEAYLTINADASARGAGRARPAFSSNAGGGNVTGSASSLNYFTNGEQMIPGEGYLWLFSVRNIGSSGSPDWRVAWSGGRMGGTAAAQVMPQGTSFSSWLSTANPFFRQFFSDLNSWTTPSGSAVENLAVLWHDIPWDGPNDRPDLSVVQQLLDGTATYESASFLNGGTIKDWRKLANTTDLADYGADARAAATIRGTLVDATAIGTGLWLGSSSITITEKPSGWVYGGRGSRTQTFSGTYTGGVTALQFRVERNTGTIASPVWTLVSTYDWQTAGGLLGGGNWSFSLPSTGLPVGNDYRIRIRDATLTATEATTANRWHVGTVTLVHGQSQMQIAETAGRGIRSPIAGMAASVVRIEGGGRNAGPTSYSQPTLAVIDLTTASSTGGGYMAMASAYWQATGEANMYLDMTVEGTGLAQWNNNDAYGNNFYRGDNASLPTVGSINGSGIMTMFALFSDRYRDVDIFNWGTSDTSTWAAWTGKMATYRGHLATYFSNSTSAPMVIMPYPRSNGGGTLAQNLSLRETQRTYAKGTAATFYGSDILDIIMESDGSNHPRADITDVSGATREIAGEGMQRMGLTMGRALAAWATSGSIALGAPVATAAVFTNPTRNIIEIECNQTLRTESGAALAQLADVSTDSGTSWSRTGFTATLSGNKLRLTKDTGSWPTGTTRVRYMEALPFQSPTENTEAAAASLVNGLVYGPVQSWRDGRGMHLQPTGATGLSVAESNVLVPVAGSVSLVAGSATLGVTYTVVPVPGSVAIRAGTADLGGGAPLVPQPGRIGLVGGSGALDVIYTATGIPGQVSIVAGSATLQFIQADDPTLSPVSLHEAKAWLKEEDSDEQDELITGLIRAAAAWIEERYGIVCLARDQTFAYPRFGRQLMLHRRPLNSIIAVEYDAADGTAGTLAPADWRIREYAGLPALVPAFGASFPGTEEIPGAVRVTFNAGYASRAEVPDGIRQAALHMIAHWFMNREAVTTGPTAEVPQSAKALMQPYRRVFFA
jgi:uncharacterized phiE125 gp8 family phage protein